jgi:hypothetical protein
MEWVAVITIQDPVAKTIIAVNRLEKLMVVGLKREDARQ